MSVSTSQALEYLQGLPGMTQAKLYTQPSAALAIFRRMLPHLAKTIVMAMLYMPKPFPATDLDLWLRPDARRYATMHRDLAMSVLESLHIITTAQEKQGPKAYSLSKDFAKSLKNALTGGGNHSSFGVPINDHDRQEVSIAFLDDYARTQWETILYYMVGSAGTAIAGNHSISSGTKTLLSIGGFVEMKLNRTVITQTGFTFLLQEVNAQVWSLLIVYLENAPTLNMDEVDVLSFLFMLGSLELGQAYSTANLTATQQHMLDDLNDFGIIYRKNVQSSRFYPTRLATTLTSDAGALMSESSSFQNALRSGSESKGYIIIETNYRLYAYTTSLLQIAVLNLFTRLSTRFPNLVSGKLTKESIQRAISYGITSDQIISYLTTHAHPQMQKTVPILPPTVVDQIRLWQIEGDRMRATPGFLMQGFDLNAYTDVSNYAEALGVLVWKSDAKRSFFVSKIDQISAYIKGSQKGKKGE
ncbi:RNA polymerase II transcription factor B subunit 2 [Patellaria atrata CBS 101060]|uniref:RNA polymerase II transcription factor B subunit 2 n=1 Tax=Patellaria atrata CBS 101060 TaxID=1346257 RepID=A0A9P4SIH5_9PEZI|nr:RNA polymerase II transcription factor B subunit 2 [Patellaria atrata CBS 101060]